VSSSVPSKTTSEVGATSDEDPSRVMSPADPLTAKDKAALTREEREAKYKEVRERIFGPNDEASVPDTQLVGETSADMSRSSSSSGKKKPRKQRTPVDDTFEARSQFNIFYPGVPFVGGGQSNYPGTFPEQSYVSPYPMSPDPSMGISYMPNQSPGTQMFIPQNPLPNLQPYQMGTPVNYGQSDGWMNGTPIQWPPYLNFGPAPQIPSQQSSAKSSPAMNNYVQPTTPQFQHPNRSWAPSPYQSPYQPQPTHQPLPTRWPEFPSQPYGLGTPYQYGQLPSQPFNPGASPANQHPIPGSYTRPPFNPQSRAFVPSGGSPLRFHGTKAHSTPPNVGLANSGHPFVSPEVSAQPQPNNQGQGSKTDSIAKWGRPAHLPPKPPPSEDPSAFDMSHQIAQNFGPGLLVAKSAAVGTPTGQQGLPHVQSPHSGY
jgi:SUZ domain